MDMTKVGRWVIIVLLIGCIPAIVLLTRFIISLFADKGPRKTEYCEDRFFGMVHGDGEYGYGGIPTNIWCFCPTCDTRLVYGENRLSRTVSFTCELCQRRLYETAGDKDYAVAQTFRQIERKLRKGEWLQEIKPKKVTHRRMATELLKSQRNEMSRLSKNLGSTQLVFIGGRVT